MASVTYLIAPCAGGSAIDVEFDASSLPVVGGNYFLTFTGSTDEGCYEIVDTAEPGTGSDGVATMSENYGDCITCLAVPTPTPTASVTPTNTPTLTQTPSQTPSITPSQTTTNTQSPTTTNTQSPTTTNTPTTSETSTPTPSITASQTPTPSITASQTVTPTPTGTSAVTPTPTKTPGATPTNTQTPTGTSAVTPTPTPSVTTTQTPSPTPFGSFSANTFYQWTNEMEGSFSGGTWEAGLGNVPHPVNQAMIGDKRGTVQDLSAVALGGFNGLNN